MTKRLVIDLESCTGCPECTARCAYFYRARPADHGIDTLRERASFALLCRRCPEPTCVKACAFGALERTPDGLLQRHNLRCVSCTLCAHACPFGIIDPRLLNFYETPCDYCTGRLGEGQSPPCVGSCGRSALRFAEVDPAQREIDGKPVHRMGKHLAVLADAWPHDDGEGS